MKLTKLISYLCRWLDNRFAKSFAKSRKMKRKVKFACSFICAVFQYWKERKEGKAVMTKSEFVRKYYYEYLELNESELTKAEGNFY